MPGSRRALTLLFAVLGVGALALLSYASLSFAKSAVRKQAESSIRSTSAITARYLAVDLHSLAGLEASFARRQALVQALAGPAGGDDGATMRSVLVELTEAQAGITSAGLLDASGRLLEVVPSTPSIVGKSFAFRDYFRAVTRTGGTYLSGAFRSAAKGQPLVVSVASPVVDPNNHRRLGVLVLGYSLDALQDFARGFARVQEVSLAITDQFGVGVADAASVNPPFVSRRAQPWVSDALAGRSGIAYSKDARGGPALIAYSPVAGTGWTVSAALPTKQAFAGLAPLRRAVLAVALLLGALILVGAFLLDRMLRKREEAELELTDAKRRQAETANLAKSEFLSRMSHELRTPLNAVLGFAQLLEFDTLSVAQEKYVQQIIRGGRHLLGLINEVLEISRIETGELGLSREPVPVGSTIDDAISLVAPLAQERSIQIAWEPGQLHGCYVEADLQRLNQVLLNLLSNAVKYNREGGQISITLLEREGRLRIAVSDTGHGIPPDQLELLFNPFERLGAEQTGVEGTGLGLTLSRSLVEAMGGTMDVDSEVGRGSTFAFELPVAQRPGAPSLEAEPQTSATARPAGIKVLCVEDNIANFRLLEGAFAQRPDLELIWAADAASALELATLTTPALVLLDVHLPDGHGETVLAGFRDHSELREIPVVVVSADATARQERRMRAAGAVEYLTKPIDIRRLLAIVDELLPKEMAA
jgi:signal transduction histidine kinase/CheY-like chemotaxis protein